MFGGGPILGIMYKNSAVHCITKKEITVTDRKSYSPEMSPFNDTILVIIESPNCLGFFTRNCIRLVPISGD